MKLKFQNNKSNIVEINILKDNYKRQFYSY